MQKFLFVGLIAVIGCGKSDITAPEIIVVSPTQNQVFTNGQSVIINAIITDNEGIHMVHVTALDNTTSGHMVHFEEHLDSKNYTANQSFIVQAGRNYSIEIEATDHNENTTKKELTVSAN